MDRDVTRDLMRRAALGYVARDQPRDDAQWIPINVYETPDDIVVTAPMPGVEADNIDIEVHGRHMSLRASLRGKDQERRQYHIHEWTYGPYERSLELPADVDASRANASHGNGVLVVSMPKASHARAVHIPLRQVTSSEAVHEGHSGRQDGGTP